MHTPPNSADQPSSKQLDLARFSHAVHQELTRRGIEQQELADELGVSQATISNWVNRKKGPGTKNLKKVMAVLDLSWDQIRRRSPSHIRRSSKAYALSKSRRSRRAQALFAEEISLSIYTDVRANDDNGHVVYPDQGRHNVRLPYDFIAHLIGFVPPHRIGVTFADGDSMRPTIKDQEMVIYRPTQRVAEGGLYVLLRDDDLIVKRVQKISGGGYRLISDNKQHNYQDEMIIPYNPQRKNSRLVNKETQAPVELYIVGKVIFPDRETDTLHLEQVTQIISDLISGRNAEGLPPNRR